MQECLQIKPKNWKQFQVKAPKGLKCREIYKIDFNANGLPLDCTFIAGVHQKFISVILINQLDETIFIPRAQHIGSVKKLEGRKPSDAEVYEILHKFQTVEQQVDKVNANTLDDFITSSDQV